MELAGIDVQKGLKTVNNNSKLYTRLLGTFVAGNMQEALLEAVTSGDSQKIAAQAHAIKGVAGNLSLTQVMDLAASIEAKAKNDTPISEEDPVVSEFKNAYAKTMESIKTITDDPSVLDQF